MVQTSFVKDETRRYWKLFSLASARLRKFQGMVAEWTDPRTNTTYHFRSYVPQTVRVKLGESVDVLIDPNNPRRYTVTSVNSVSMKMR